VDDTARPSSLINEHACGVDDAPYLFPQSCSRPGSLQPSPNGSLLPSAEGQPPLRLADMVPETGAVRPGLIQNPFVSRFLAKGCAIFFSLSSACHDTPAVFPRRAAAVRLCQAGFPHFHGLERLTTGLSSGKYRYIEGRPQSPVRAPLKSRSGPGKSAPKVPWIIPISHRSYPQPTRLLGLAVGSLGGLCSWRLGAAKTCHGTAP